MWCGTCSSDIKIASKKKTYEEAHYDIRIKKENTYQYFVDLIDQNIHLFGEAVREKLELAEHEKLTDDEFVECYVDGMSRMVGQIYENAGETLRADAKCYARFCDAIKHPERYGFRFQNKIITIGKVYLCYMLGKTRKRAPKADCNQTGALCSAAHWKECLECGIVQ